MFFIECEKFCLFTIGLTLKVFVKKRIVFKLVIYLATN